jgi:membrane-bound lytic murein transglycosylase B
MKKQAFLFLSASVIILTVALGLSSAYENRQAEIRNLEQQLDQMHEIRRQLEDAEDRMADLEQMLLNLRRMEQIVSGDALPSRGGRLTLTTMPLTMPSGFTAERLDRALADTALAGLGQALCRAEKETGINGVILAAICAHESGWGESRLAREKNNLAGMGAYDGREYSCGMTFGSREDCVMYLAELLRDKPGTLDEIGAWYASDPGWAEKVAGCMKMIAEAGVTP